MTGVLLTAVPPVGALVQYRVNEPLCLLGSAVTCNLPALTSTILTQGETGFIMSDNSHTAIQSLSLKLSYIFKNQALTSQRTYCDFINRLMLLTEVIAVSCENLTEHTKIHCVGRIQNISILNHCQLIQYNDIYDYYL